MEITLKDVEKILRSAYIFKEKPSNITVYRKAFTHKSWDNINNYETMEFYGDSIISAVAVQYIFCRYCPQNSEDKNNLNQGEMTKIKNQIVSTKYLSKLAAYFSLSSYVFVSDYFENMHGRDTEKLLEDCFEAFVAAIAIDISYETARQFVFFCMDNLVNYGHLLSKKDNYKNQILNYFQVNGWNFPIYQIDTELGLPQTQKSFVVSLLKNKKVICKGVGKTKKEAEMNASKNALIFFQFC